jgi:hypothetical protein
MRGRLIVAPVIAELQASGATSLRAIADGLNAKKIQRRGNGEWAADSGDARSGTKRSLSGHDPRPGAGIGASVGFENHDHAIQGRDVQVSRHRRWAIARWSSTRKPTRCRSMRAGFAPEGEKYEEVGISHRTMRRVM